VNTKSNAGCGAKAGSVKRSWARRSARAVRFPQRNGTFMPKSSTTPRLHPRVASSQEKAWRIRRFQEKGRQGCLVGQLVAERAKPRVSTRWYSIAKTVFCTTAGSKPVSDGAREAGEVAVPNGQYFPGDHRGEGGRPVYRQDSEEQSSTSGPHQSSCQGGQGRSSARIQCDRGGWRWQGIGGVRSGKANEVPEAIRKGVEKAKRTWSPSP